MYEMPADNNSTDNWWWSNFLSAPDGSIKGRWRGCLVLFPVLAGSFTPSLSFSSFTLYSVTLNSPHQLDLEGNEESRSAWSIKRHVLSIRGLYADKWAGWALLKDWSDGQGASGHLAGLAVPQLKVLCDFLDAHATFICPKSTGLPCSHSGLPMPGKNACRLQHLPRTRYQHLLQDEVFILTFPIDRLAARAIKAPDVTAWH